MTLSWTEILQRSRLLPYRDVLSFPREHGSDRAVKRREFIAALGGTIVAWPLVARAQQPAMPVIGVLWPGQTPPGPPRMESFTQALRQLGFIEGQSVSIELRYARRGLQQLPELAAELVRMKVDVLATFGDLTPKIAQQATETIPIVAISDDIVGAGIVASLSRPGANTTGLTIMAPELSAKRLEVLQEMVPQISRVTALWDPTTGAAQVETTERAARSLNLTVQVVEVRGRNDIVDAFRAAQSNRADAVNVFNSPVLSSLYREIIDLSAEHRLPTMYQWKEHVEAGGLLSYGVNLTAMWRQAGTIVVKVLKGEKPAELPVEQPTKFELAVNARTAKALGIAIPPSVLVRADEVFE
jgi:putative tryptophan/tyrosine transport system substrate-binding protein